MQQLCKPISTATDTLMCLQRLQASTVMHFLGVEHGGVNASMHKCRYFAACAESCLCSLSLFGASAAPRAVARAAGQPHPTAQATPAGRPAAPAATAAAAAAASAAAAGLLQRKGPCCTQQQQQQPAQASAIVSVYGASTRDSAAAVQVRRTLDTIQTVLYRPQQHKHDVCFNGVCCMVEHSELRVSEDSQESSGCDSDPLRGLCLHARC